MYRVGQKNGHKFCEAWGLFLNLENKTDVGPSDNLVQLIKAHSLHSLSAVFEINRNLKKMLVLFIYYDDIRNKRFLHFFKMLYYEFS